MMVEAVNDGQFWLPVHFLTDDDLLLVNQETIINPNGVNVNLEAAACFPTEFPFEFSLFCSSNSALNLPVKTVICSKMETECSDEDFMASLTRDFARSSFEKSSVLPRSPQSTLSGIGSWSCKSASSSNGSPIGPSQVTSPRTTPCFSEKYSWDLIHAAAEQVEKLKTNCVGPTPRYIHGRGLENSCSLFHSNEAFLSHALAQRNQIQQLKYEMMNQKSKQEVFSQQLNHFTEGNRGGRFSSRHLGLPQSAWPSLQAQHQNRHPHHQQPVRSGTGVFLPRPYNNSNESLKKSNCSTVLLPKRDVQTLNLNMVDMNAHFNGGCFAPGHETLMGRRNSQFTQQKRNYCPEPVLNLEISLPQEWTY